MTCSIPVAPYARLPKAPGSQEPLRRVYGILTTLPRRSLTEYSDARPMDSACLGVIRSGDDRERPRSEDPRLRDGSGSVAFMQRSSGGRVVDRLPSLLINESAPHPPQPPGGAKQGRRVI